LCFFGEKITLISNWEISLIKLCIMRYKVIDVKSQHFGKVLDFESCATLNDLGGVLLKIGRNKVSLFKFNEVELV